MALTQKDIDRIIKFVKTEPRTIQDISRLIARSWVTADSYVQQVKERTGMVNIKTFRKGSQGALKLVYYNYAESLTGDDVREELYDHIRGARQKQDFDFFEIFQFVSDKKKKVFYDEYEEDQPSPSQKLVQLLRQTESSLLCFSGNMSFINTREGKTGILDVFEELVKRKVRIKVLCRVNVASLNNISKLSALLKKHPGYIEIRHRYQPLRGFIIDDDIARFKNDETLQNYKEGELNKDMHIFYEIYDGEWISWLQKVFWNLYRPSIDYNTRVKQFERFF